MSEISAANRVSDFELNPSARMMKEGVVELRIVGCLPFMEYLLDSDY